MVNAKTKRVGYLSQTYVGKTYDKKIVDTEAIRHPRDAILYKDTGFQGYEPQVRQSHQPKKKPRKGTLTWGQTRHNRKLSRVRVRMEHAIAGMKRSGIVKELFRNTKGDFSDLV